MASPTKRTSRIRKVKLGGKGKRRKATLRTKGTTKTPAQLFGDK